MKSSNNYTVRWIAIIVGLVICFSSITLNIVQATAITRTENNHERILSNTKKVQELETQWAVIENELIHVNRKLETLLDEIRMK